jgi:hypothetical protein
MRLTVNVPAESAASSNLSWSTASPPAAPSRQIIEPKSWIIRRDIFWLDDEFRNSTIITSTIKSCSKTCESDADLHA